jgi:hypothetical protein
MRRLYAREQGANVADGTGAYLEGFGLRCC